MLYYTAYWMNKQLEGDPFKLLINTPSESQTMRSKCTSVRLQICMISNQSRTNTLIQTNAISNHGIPPATSEATPPMKVNLSNQALSLGAFLTPVTFLAPSPSFLAPSPSFLAPSPSWQSMYVIASSWWIIYFPHMSMLGGTGRVMALSSLLYLDAQFEVQPLRSLPIGSI